MHAAPPALPPLPAWHDPPTDPPAAIAEFKAATRARLAAAGRAVDDVFSVVDRLVAERGREISDANRECGTAWPVIDFADIANGTVGDAQRDLVHRRGCVVVRGHFERDQALGWDRDIVDYVTRNEFFESYAGPGDEFFSSVGSKPEIYPIYWSKPQMEARQSTRMADVQRFLNGLWTSHTEDTTWFDPDHSAMYPDRIRRRPEGATSGGLGAHIDAGTLDLWLKPEYQRAFHHLFDGTIEQFDPWSAAHRTTGGQYPGTTMTSVFRTFQGWTALSDMDHDQGVLHTVPIPEAIAYLLLRPLLDDVDAHDMCGVTVSRAFSVNHRWHTPLLAAASGIPDVRAGDSVWWHCDLIHSVAPVDHQRGWGNVMYIPAAPWCPRNARYAESVRAAFADGSSPSDFPHEHYERSWTGRFREADLNHRGRAALGLTD